MITGEALKQWLNDNNLSQRQAANMCSVTPRTFRRWVNDMPSIPKGMWELLNIKIKGNKNDSNNL